MYSVVLATMLAAGSTTPAWHHGHSCYSSCYSCYSSCSCYAGYSGYAGYSHHCHSYRSCYCSSYYCTSSYCSSYCTTYVYPSCSYCSTCYSSCHCSSTIIVGATTPQVIPVPSSTSEIDALRSEVDRLRKALEKGEKLSAPKKDKDGVTAPSQTSRVTVLVPSDARLWIENVECPLTSSVRSFNTPPLSGNQQYVYNIKMEVVRDGRTVSQSQRAVITPGQPVQVDFNAGVLTTASR